MRVAARWIGSACRMTGFPLKYCGNDSEGAGLDSLPLKILRVGVATPNLGVSTRGLGGIGCMDSRLNTAGMTVGECGNDRGGVPYPGNLYKPSTAIDGCGSVIHHISPRVRQARIARIPFHHRHSPATIHYQHSITNLRNEK